MYLTRERIDLNQFLNAGADFRPGASVLFLGIVRNRSEGKEVLYLEYEAYEEMAERVLEELAEGGARMIDAAKKEPTARCAAAALTIYDMAKSYDPAMTITDLHLIKKTGGKSDDDQSGNHYSE